MMRRAHRRLHFWLWILIAASVIGLASMILSAPRPDTTEPYKPATE